MSHALDQARRTLGAQLRDLRKDAGLTGRELAELAGWQGPKISKIEHGRQTPSESDIHQWCHLVDAESQIPALIAAVRDIELMYVEWRRSLSSGTRRRQNASVKLEAATRLFRWYEPVLIPGILHTRAYAEAVLARGIDFYEIPNDLDEGVAARMERQRILTRGNHRLHLVLAQQALRTIVGSREVTREQLKRLIEISRSVRVHLGIIPDDAPYCVPSHNFIMFDDRLVNVETISAELSISQPQEIALYSKSFAALAADAIYGDAARNLIGEALDGLTEKSEENS